MAVRDLCRAEPPPPFCTVFERRGNGAARPRRVPEKPGELERGTYLLRS